MPVRPPSEYFDQFIEKDKPVGINSGCVSLVKFFDPSLGVTNTWVKGEAVLGNNTLEPGTPIATFEGKGGKYNGGEFKHAAIYPGQAEGGGIIVMDQWNKIGKAVVRTIRTNGKRQNNATKYYVIK